MKKLLLILVLFAAPLQASITFGTITTGSTNTSSTTTFQVTVSAGSLNLLVVSAQTRGTNNITGVTFNGDALTSAIAVNNATTANLHCSIWYLKVPDVGTFDVVITAAGSNSWVAGAAIPMAGVDQTNTVDDTDSTFTAMDTTHTISLPALTTTVVNTAVVDCLAAQSGPDQEVMTAETNRVEREDLAVAGAGDDEAHASTILPKTTAAAVTMEWTIVSEDGFMAEAAAAFRPDLTAPSAGGIQTSTRYRRNQ